MLLMIDNYDSFTYTLVNYLESLGVEVLVKQNDTVTIADIVALAPDYIMISPGPGTPSEAGVSLAVVERFAGEIPLFGVCLGFQAIGQAWGALVCNASEVMHGKTSLVHHRDQGVLRNMPQPFTATRYHSLVLSHTSFPNCLEVTGWTEQADGSQQEIMALRHRELALEGVQFHPESVLTDQGLTVLQNFIESY